MRVKTKEKIVRDVKAIFTFNEEELQALKKVSDICLDIEQTLDNKKVGRMTSELTRDVIEAEKLARFREAINGLIQSNHCSWDLKW